MKKWNIKQKAKLWAWTWAETWAKKSSFLNFFHQIYSLFNGEKTDGYDCGDEIGDALTKYLKVEGKRSIRLLCFLEGLYTERDKASNPLYWHNNPVPKVNDKVIVFPSLWIRNQTYFLKLPIWIWPAIWHFPKVVY